MSSSRTNGLTKDYSGKFGDQYVLRRRNGKSLMVKLPEKTSKEPTSAQVAVKQRFLAAAEFAKRILALPEYRNAYAARGRGMRTAYNVAMSDFFSPPAVLEIGVADYRGHAGDTIRVLAVDNFRVVRVSVTLISGDNTDLETGECIQDPGSAMWVYTVAADHLPLAGQKVKAVAFDIPANMGEAICEV